MFTVTYESLGGLNIIIIITILVFNVTEICA